MSEAIPNRRLIVPAITAAGTASSLICVGWGLFAFGAGLIALTRQGQPIAGLLFSPFVGAGLAVICGFLALLPAITWAVSALVVAPWVLSARRGVAQGALLGLICSVPTLMVASWIGRHSSNWGTVTVHIDGPMVLASLAGGVGAGMILARLVRSHPDFAGRQPALARISR